MGKPKDPSQQYHRRERGGLILATAENQKPCVVCGEMIPFGPWSRCSPCQLAHVYGGADANVEAGARDRGEVET